MRLPLPPLLERLGASLRRGTAGAERRTALAVLLVTVPVAAHLARPGTASWRLTAAVAVSVAVGAVVGWRLVAARRWRSADWLLARLLPAGPRERAQRAVRLAMVQPSSSGCSPQLAQLHLERQLQPLGPATVAARARVFNRRQGWTSVGLSLALLALCAPSPWRVVEGLDVLLARAGVAPVPLPWLEQTQLSVRPPRYLHQPERRHSFGWPISVAAGSSVIVEGRPLFTGRRLLLSDGVQEVPFVEDGQGGLVARLTVAQDGELRVVARFGEVIIREAERTRVTALPDLPPEVRLEGAPGTLPLGGRDRVELAWEAVDDHGLRQVDLVLESGGRSERRALSRFDEDTTSARGAHALAAEDPFLRRAFLPVTVRVEARDNEPAATEKWGRSEAWTLTPPALGAAEALRWAALLQGRDALVDLGARLEREPGASPSAQRQWAAAAAHALRAALDAEEGAALSSGARRFFQGQLALLARPLRPGESLPRRASEVALAVDAGLKAVGRQYAASVARRLAEVLDEAELAARQARAAEQPERVLPGLDATLRVALSASAELRRLGSLGWDLGGVAVANLGRAERARAALELQRVEWVAHHLAERLRRPVPSFSMAGGGGGTESGSGEGQEPASRSDERFDQLAQELAELTREHAQELDSVQQALEAAERAQRGSPLDAEQLRERAERLREATRPLPTSGNPDTGRGSAAIAREHAGSMADALERQELDAALESGKQALLSLGDAERRARAPRSVADQVGESELRAARRALEQELQAVERQRAERRRAASHEARRALQGAAEREQGLAQRAGNLASRGKTSDAALPDSASDALERAEALMQRAARELSEGDAGRALELQREAQRLLENADSGPTTSRRRDPQQAGEEPSPEPGEREGGRRLKTGGEVPEASPEARAEAFRRRVLEGLGKDKSGRLAPAVRRYAEGLLQ